MVWVWFGFGGVWMGKGRMYVWKYEMKNSISKQTYCVSVWMWMGMSKRLITLVAVRQVSARDDTAIFNANHSFNSSSLSS